jgi:hypothetical protein
MPLFRADRDIGICFRVLWFSPIGLVPNRAQGIAPCWPGSHARGCSGPASDCPSRGGAAVAILCRKAWIRKFVTPDRFRAVPCGHPIPAAVMAMRLSFSNRPAWLRLAIVGTLGVCARLTAAASTMAVDVDAGTTSSFVAWSLADLTWQSYPASRRGALAGDGMLPVRTVKLAARLVAVEYRGGTFRCFVEKDAFSALPPPAPSQISIRNQRKPFNPLFPHAH